MLIFNILGLFHNFDMQKYEKKRDLVVVSVLYPTIFRRYDVAWSVLEFWMSGRESQTTSLPAG